MAEQSAGGHCGEESAPNNGWRPAMVSAGYNREFFDAEYRNSDRIIWDNQEVITRIWKRILQGEGMKEYFPVLKGKEYEEVVGWRASLQDRYVISEKGPNERMRFLKYGAGQYFRRMFDHSHPLLFFSSELIISGHCDGMYETPDSDERSYFTMHVYLNDSAQALDGLVDMDIDGEDSPNALLQGGATTFHGKQGGGFYDADPLVGRVLIFQQRGLLHSGDDVIKGVKYTMRSDLMYCLDYDEGDLDEVPEDGGKKDEAGGWITFGN